MYLIQILECIFVQIRSCGNTQIIHQWLLKFQEGSCFLLFVRHLEPILFFAEYCHSEWVLLVYMVFNVDPQMLLDCSPGSLEVHWTTRFLIAFLMLSLNCVSWKCLRHRLSWIYLVDTKEKVQCNRMYYIDTLDVWVTRSLEYLCTHSNYYLILCQVLFVGMV